MAAIAIGDLAIRRIGFGTMRLTGPGAFGPPANLDSARATLRSLAELGVDFVDTSNAFGPMVSELLVREALHPYHGIVVATKGGLLRPGPNQWRHDGRPASLRAAVDASLSVLGIERIDLWYLHVDPAIPIDDQLATVADLQHAGKIRHAGLSDASVEQIIAAGKHFTVASVQNAYHLIERRHEPVVEHCERAGIPFVAYFPLATGALAASDSIIARVATRIGATPAQTALAWLLKRSPLLVAIPGTTNPAHARENIGAAALALDDATYSELERIGRKAALLRAPK
jgi:aryl-alcohol dehydrogenase-like predicted oxidoreductase